MKTVWSIRRTPRELAKWRVSKATELEEKTGVPWSNWEAHGKIVFMPYLHKDVVADSMNADTLFESVGENYKTFLVLSEESGLKFIDVMAASLHLIKNSLVIPTVCRMGKVIAIKRMR